MLSVEGTWYDNQFLDLDLSSVVDETRAMDSPDRSTFGLLLSPTRAVRSGSRALKRRSAGCLPSPNHRAPHVPQRGGGRGSRHARLELEQRPMPRRQRRAGALRQRRDPTKKIARGGEGRAQRSTRRPRGSVLLSGGRRTRRRLREAGATARRSRTGFVSRANARPLEQWVRLRPRRPRRCSPCRRHRQRRHHPARKPQRGKTKSMAGGSKRSPRRLRLPREHSSRRPRRARTRCSP
jgi:hypothetical protein